jgi:hypothetical protein
VPGEYTITLRVGGKQFTKPVRVELDPRVQISEADLLAQLNAALELRDLSSTLNALVARIDDLNQQLTTLAQTRRRSTQIAASTNGSENERETNGAAGRAARGASANNIEAEINGALDDLKKLRATLVREGPLNYRYPPKLREEVNSLMNSIVSAIAPPTEPQKLRLREVTEETKKAMADFNAFLTTRIKKVNDGLSDQPHVVAGSPVR